MAQNRREQLQAYRFMQRRVRTALLDADPDTNDAPLRRMGSATYAGIMVAILVLAGAGIYGIVRPGGSTAWKKAGALIVERETSTRYVYLQNVLYQVANFSSAKLLLGDRLTVVTVSRNSLARASHGGTIGIAGAPDAVPDASHIAGVNWSSCVAGDLRATAAVPLQLRPGSLATGTELSGANGVLVQAGPNRYLLWNGRAFGIPARWLTALRYTEPDAPAVNVTADFVATIPAGETLAPVVVPGADNPGPRIGGLPGTKLGQVLQDTVNRDVYYLVVSAGLQNLTPLQATLQLAQNASGANPNGANPNGVPTPVNSTALTGTTITALSNRPPINERGPTVRPLPAAPASGRQLCVLLPATGPASLVYGAAPAGSDGDAGAGQVRLPTGYGALVAAVVSPGQSVGVTYLVTATAQKFALTSAAVNALGLSAAPVAQLAARVLQVIPNGPALDPDAARQVAGVR